MFPKHMHAIDIIRPPAPLKTEGTSSCFQYSQKNLITVQQDAT